LSFGNKQPFNLSTGDKITAHIIFEINKEFSKV